MYLPDEEVIFRLLGCALVGLLALVGLFLLTLSVMLFTGGFSCAAS